MGAFDLGFQQGAGAGAEDLARSRQLQDQQRQQNLQRNWSILNDPNSTDDVKQAAGQDIQNQYPTPAHKGTFLSDILHIHAKNQAANGNNSPATSNASAAPDDSSSASPIAPPPSAPLPASGKDQLGVPFDFSQPAQAAPSVPAPSPAATSAPAPSPSGPNLKSVASASTPQAAMDLWKQYRGPTAIAEDVAQTRAKNAAGFAQTLADKNNASRIMEAQIRAHGNVSMQRLDAAAQSLGAEDFASAQPDVKMAAMKNLATANRAPAWKSVTDGNSIYAVNSLDPNQRTLLGHKDDLTQRQEFRTMTNPDGSTFLVPVTVWSKKGSSTPVMETQDDQGSAAPMSSTTPQGPASVTPALPVYATPSSPSTPSAATPGSSPSATQGSAPISSATPQAVPGAAPSPSNPGARQPGTRPVGAAVKSSSAPTRIPSSSVGTPIPFGGKPSELTKSDTSQYTKLAEDSNAKQESLQIAQEASRSPSPTSDKALVYAWVRSNVQGAGRMTQSEFQNALSTGSFDQRIANWWSQATTGKMTPEIRQMIMTDIQRSARTSQTMADSARNQVQQDIGQKPKSTKTPSSPGGAPKNAADYLKSIGLQ